MSVFNSIDAATSEPQMQVVAYAQPPRSSLPCGPRALKGVRSDVGTPASCSTPLSDTLRVERARTSNPALFVREPVITLSGSLEFQLADAQAGSATFNVMMKSPKSGAASQAQRRLMSALKDSSSDGVTFNVTHSAEFSDSDMETINHRMALNGLDSAELGPASRHTLAATADAVLIVSFTVNVTIPRYSPSFRPTEVVLLEDSGSNTLVFAMDVKSGVPGNSQASVLALSWTEPYVDFSPLLPSSIVTSAFDLGGGWPKLRTRLVGTQLVGTVTLAPFANVTGTFEMYVSLNDTTAGLISPNMTVFLRIIPVNDPPFAAFRDAYTRESQLPASNVPHLKKENGQIYVHLKQDSGIVNVSDFVKELHLGPYDEDEGFGS
jgi:hypothetical protein